VGTSVRHRELFQAHQGFAEAFGFFADVSDGLKTD
jgi:hypothetical protein